MEKKKSIIETYEEKFKNGEMFLVKNQSVEEYKDDLEQSLEEIEENKAMDIPPVHVIQLVSKDGTLLTLQGTKKLKSFGKK